MTYPRFLHARLRPFRGAGPPGVSAAAAVACGSSLIFHDIGLASPNGMKDRKGGGLGSGREISSSACS